MADEVTLREITAETVRAICNLDVAPEQHGYVASNAVSIAQAYFQPRAWFRAVYAAETPVGFVMFDIDPESELAEEGAARRRRRAAPPYRTSDDKHLLGVRRRRGTRRE